MTSNTMCNSSSNVFSWKISLEDWTKATEGELLLLQFVSMVPPEGKRIKWNLGVYPKGNTTDKEETKFVDVCLSIDEVEFDLDVDTEHEMKQFQIETSYRIRQGVVSWPMDMSDSRSLSIFHSSVFREFKFQWLDEESYEVGNVKDRAVDGFLTLDFEFKTYSAPRMKFQTSMNKQEFVNNFETVDPENGDVKLVCGDKELFCHKFLLISQSPVFRAMFQMNSKEKEENVVNIVDCTPEAVAEFVFYLYNAALRTIYSSEDLELIFGLLNLANKYQIQLLMNGCVDTLMDIMDVNNVLKIVAVVDKFELGSDITDIVIRFMKKNITVIVDKEDWAAFLNDHPSLVKDFILNMNKDIVDAKDNEES